MNEPRLYSEAEELTLREWSFVSDYEREGIRAHLLGLAQGIHLAARSIPGGQTFEAPVLAELLATTLRRDIIFSKLVSDKLWIPPNRASIFADILARYVVGQEWFNIT